MMEITKGVKRGRALKKRSKTDNESTSENTTQRRKTENQKRQNR